MSVVGGCIKEAAEGIKDIKNNELLVPFDPRERQQQSDQHVPIRASPRTQCTFTQLCRG